MFGAQNNPVQVDLLKKGMALTFDEALATIRTGEASDHQAENLYLGQTAAIQRVE